MLGCALSLALLITGCSSGYMFNKQLVGVDGYQMEYAVDGEGRPAIVFISGGGPADMDTWRKVYPQAKAISKVFAYNRLGDGNSDRSPEPQTGEKIVAALSELLRKADVNSPYVLVGHSLGGIYANLFARLRPEEVVGVVLVDSSHPDQAEQMRSGFGGWINRAFLKIYAAINPTKASEVVSFDETVAQLRRAGAFPDIPLVVVSAGKRPSFGFDEMIEVVKAHQRSLATLSPQGRQVIAEKSGHFVQYDSPEVVIEAIREVVAQARVDSAAAKSRKGKCVRIRLHVSARAGNFSVRHRPAPCSRRRGPRSRRRPRSLRLA